MKAAVLFDVRGLSVLITGAGSSIGIGYARGMADHGVHVIATDDDACPRSA